MTDMTDRSKSNTSTSTSTPTVSSQKKRELTSPDFPFEPKKNKVYSSPGSDTATNMSGKSEQIFDNDEENELSMVTEGATGGDYSEHSGDSCATSVKGGMASEQPNLNISLKEDDLKGISVFLKDSICGELRDDMRIEIGSMIQGIVDGVLRGLNENIDQLNTKIDSLTTENKALKEDNEKLKTSVSRLEGEAEAAEQYSRRNCIRVSGVRETVNENTDEIVLDMSRALSLELNISEIDRSHRIGRRTESKPRDIIVKFSTYRVRQRVYKARTKLKDSGYAGVFINEDLTKYRSTILYRARKLVKERRILGAWSSNGTVLVRDNNDGVHRLMKEADLSAFLNARPRNP